MTNPVESDAMKLSELMQVYPVADMIEEDTQALAKWITEVRKLEDKIEDVELHLSVRVNWTDYHALKEQTAELLKALENIATHEPLARDGYGRPHLDRRDAFKMKEIAQQAIARATSVPETP